MPLIHSIESKQHLRELALAGYSSGKRKKLIGIDNPQFGKPGNKIRHSGASIELIKQKAIAGYASGKRVKLFGKDNPYFGKSPDREELKRISTEWWDTRGRETFKGPGNPNWKGGPINHGYDSDEYRKACGIVRKRDYNSCQICKQIGNLPKNRLECHHIDVNDFNHSPLNLITYCAKCHRMIHKYLKTAFERNGLKDPVFGHESH